MKTEKNRKKLTYKGPRPIRYFLTTMVVVSALLFIQLLLFFLLSFSVAVSADNSKYYGAALVVEKVQYCLQTGVGRPHSAFSRIWSASLPDFSQQQHPQDGENTNLRKQGTL